MIILIDEMHFLTYIMHLINIFSFFMLDFTQNFQREFVNSVLHNQTKTVEELIKQYANPNYVNSFGWSLLYTNLYFKNFVIAELLLENGADANIGISSQTPLHIAIEKNATKNVINLLIEKGANIEAIDYLGRTPIFNAIEQNNIEVIEILIRYNANLKTIDNYQNNPICFGLEKNIYTFKLLANEANKHIDKYSDNESLTCLQKGELLQSNPVNM